MKVDYSYLQNQFAEIDPILDRIRTVVSRGDFTLGRELEMFEEAFADAIGVEHAIGVNSGTDAIFLPLKALGITGEVITSPFSFYATPAAINHAGATPVFADVGEDFNIDPAAIEAAITPRTEAVVPVHWAGRSCNMTAIKAIADRHQLAVIEDAAQAFGAAWDDRDGGSCGTWGDAGAFSLHPLKTLNVWGDGGVITTNNPITASLLRKYRNHGLKDRDTCDFWGYNSRLDTIQAAVGLCVLPHVHKSIMQRRANALFLDAKLADISEVMTIPEAGPGYNTYYLYTFRAYQRDRLVKWLRQHDIDTKVHYPIPLHLQPAASSLGYQRGDLPMAELLADQTITIPAHEYVTQEQLTFMSDCIFALQGAEARKCG